MVLLALQVQVVLPVLQDYLNLLEHLVPQVLQVHQDQTVLLVSLEQAEHQGLQVLQAVPVHQVVQVLPV